MNDDSSSYKVLSFDVGIKNLAYCKIEFSKETKKIIQELVIFFQIIEKTPTIKI